MKEALSTLHARDRHAKIVIELSDDRQFEGTIVDIIGDCVRFDSDDEIIYINMHYIVIFSVL